jgi:hypothetical protein
MYPFCKCNNVPILGNGQGTLIDILLYPEAVLFLCPCWFQAPTLLCGCTPERSFITHLSLGSVPYRKTNGTSWPTNGGIGVGQCMGPPCTCRPVKLRTRCLGVFVPPSALPCATMALRNDHHPLPPGQMGTLTLQNRTKIWACRMNYEPKPSGSPGLSQHPVPNTLFAESLIHTATSIHTFEAKCLKFAMHANVHRMCVGLVRPQVLQGIEGTTQGRAKSIAEPLPQSFVGLSKWTALNLDPEQSSRVPRQLILVWPPPKKLLRPLLLLIICEVVFSLFVFYTLYSAVSLSLQWFLCTSSTLGC